MHARPGTRGQLAPCWRGGQQQQEQQHLQPREGYSQRRRRRRPSRRPAGMHASWDGYGQQRQDVRLGWCEAPMAISPPAVPAAVLPRISISSRPPRTTQRMRSSFRLLAPPPGDWGLARPGGLRVRVVSEPAPRSRTRCTTLRAQCNIKGERRSSCWASAARPCGGTRRARLLRERFAESVSAACRELSLDRSCDSAAFVLFVRQNVG